MILEAGHLAKEYSDKNSSVEVIKDASLQVHRGDFIMIVGPSGSGKSTLLYLLSGLRRPSRGQVSFENKAYTDMGDIEAVQLRYNQFGFIMQQHLLVPYLNSLENVCLARTRDLKDKAGEILAELGLEKHLHKYPRELSYGERQRVAVARGLVHNPRVLFADEPTASVNAELAEFTVDYIRSYCQKGGSCIMVTHDLSLLAMATKVYALNDGVLVEN